ncbi:MAG: M20/M25/M40 family metallo-hydrolase [Candidatus Obscuribacterales bacterium]|nr:M20/M25/M40 family metallo-hydrolase [Candidatus Obscuribacterales bacterium]
MNIGTFVGLVALVSIAAAAVVWIRRYFDSTPLDSYHPGKAHTHGKFGCKFDRDEVNRTRDQKRPRIDTNDLTPDPAVAQILAAISDSDVRKTILDLSGEQPFQLGGQSVQLTSRNSYHNGLEIAMRYLEQFYSALGCKFERHSYKRRGKEMFNLIVEFRGTVNPEKVLIVGAHLDSTAGNPWSTENRAPGADDDGSGTAGLMEMARALKKMRPGCTVRLCHFTGEEQGLYGSYAYSDKVAAEKTQVIAMIEMDMIGYCNRPGNRVDVHDDQDRNGSHTLVELMTRVAARYNLGLNVFDTHNFAVHDRSDHAGFLDHGYKAVLVSEEFTDEGFTPYYHTVQDRIDKLNFPYMLNVMRMVLGAIIELAECK